MDWCAGGRRQRAQWPGYSARVTSSASTQQKSPQRNAWRMAHGFLANPRTGRGRTTLAAQRINTCTRRTYLFLKRLRCPRNSLHMHLFLSFILRALAFLLKDALFIEGVGLSGNVDFNKENVDCKVFTSFWHYVLMANYCWILMEGLYLHSLVFLAFFTDSSSILRYVALGWGLPVLFIVPWVVVRATLDDTLCWTTNPRQDLFWIIRGPITASILVNFILFLNITRVLFAKLFASQTPQARKYRYRKWFKSTLVLVPLFGAHYAFLLGMSLAAAGDLLELVWLYVDQLFSSFQGFVVALLYCFLNGEVQTELRKLIQRWRCDQRGPGRNDKQLQHRHSLFTQSVTFLSRGRSSIQSLHSMDRTKSPSPNLASSGRPFDEEGTPASQRNGDMPWSTPEDNLIEKETCL
uniref:Adenylate cyclase-coupled calcitonin receptor n=1 Tax=Rhipicephalus zambeziensis TaxID=60191 RepID=A0A224YH05_9ACAR